MAAAVALVMALMPPAMQAAVDARGLPAFDEASELESVAVRADGTELKLIPAAAEQWHAMVAAARADGVDLQAVSAFRSVDYQRGIIERKLKAGQSVEQILAVSAPPGYSEHHTGRAVDVMTPGGPILEEGFEDTDAFRWLARHACRFGFALSYPRGNAHGFSYEPWHWAWHPPS